MGTYQGLTKGGANWTPQFVISLNQDECLGCGRCFKVCSRGVLTLVGKTEDGEIVDAFDDEAETKIMSIANAEECIGCTACALTCPKNLYTHEEMALTA